VPSAKLSWTLCYGNKECAKLSVPLDYADPSGPQAAVALLKVPSKIPRGQQGYRGPILFNPGGPGGSGVRKVRNTRMISSLISSCRCNMSWGEESSSVPSLARTTT
jgi:hypothetical protein